jgi:mono/diheme cytochrome c family protein
MRAPNLAIVVLCLWGCGPKAERARPVVEADTISGTDATPAPAPAPPTDSPLVTTPAPSAAPSRSPAPRAPAPAPTRPTAEAPAAPVPDTAPAISTAAAPPPPDKWHPPPRDTLDFETYQGWKQFELNCARCHGEYAVGTSFAPALVVSLKEGGSIPTREDFMTTVCAGRPDKGMPGWCALGLEMSKIEGMYLYVKGRADGRYAAGRPALRE